ncbi:hypothetical protein ScPMuIL_017270 [Solemya velum]
MANIVVTYILWLLGGWFGLHHFYLRRDNHAFVWWCTLGGVFLGWLRDLWRLPEYVCDANNDPRFVNEFKDRVRRLSKPSFSSVRFTGELVMGALFGYITRLAIPEDYVMTVTFRLWVMLVPPLGTGVGVHLVANIGREKASLKWPVLGAYLTAVLLQYNANCIIYMALSSAVLTNWKGRQWRITKDKRGICRRLSMLSLAGCIYFGLWGSAIYFNASIRTDYGESVPVRIAIQNFFNSPAWKEMKDSLNHLYEYYKVHGWKHILDEVIKHLDPEGEQNAYSTLGLSKKASMEEIKQTYRKLSRQYHPDKQRADDNKEESLKKFMEIQKAYETLSNIKSKRRKKEQVYREAEED